MPQETVQSYLAKIGSRGGSKSTKKQIEARLRNIKKANARKKKARKLALKNRKMNRK